MKYSQAPLSLCSNLTKPNITSAAQNFTSDAALYIPASPTPSPPQPHLLARYGEGTCLHIYSTQAGDRDTILHNY